MTESTKTALAKAEEKLLELTEEQQAKLQELIEEIPPSYSRESISLPWSGEEWVSFRYATSEIKRRHELSLGAAQRTLRELCADGDIRSIRYQFQDDGGLPEDIQPIKPNEWLKDQIDFEADDDSDFEEFTGRCIDVSEDDLQHWLDKQAKAAGRPIERLNRRLRLDEWLDKPLKAPQEPSPIAVKHRAAPKERLALMAIDALWPDRATMKMLTNQQIAHQVGHWITDHCKKANSRVPEISATTILRVAGRKK
jgi:hypothetical protein